MKKIATIGVLMILLTSQTITAQQTTAGITASVAFSNVTAKFMGIKVSPKMRTGITAGFFVSAPVSKNFSFQPALNFVHKGYKEDDDYSKDLVNFSYLEVPLNFVYNTKSNEGFFVGAGPSFAYGIGGMDKYTDKNSGTTEKTKINFGSGDDEVKALDLGLNALAGYKFPGGFLITGNYNLGLNNLQNGNSSAGTIKNNYFAFKIGYTFRGAK